MSTLEMRQVSRVYGEGAARVHALREVSLEVDAGMLLLADEPSGALDPANGEAVMCMIHTACEQGVAAVVVTHDVQLAAWADRVVSIRDGRIVGEDR